jgi:hypothetical protein
MSLWSRRWERKPLLLDSSYRILRPYRGGTPVTSVGNSECFKGNCTNFSLYASSLITFQK